MTIKKFQYPALIKQKYTYAQETYIIHTPHSIQVHFIGLQNYLTKLAVYVYFLTSKGFIWECNKNKSHIEMWGSQRSAAENSCLLGCCTISTGSSSHLKGMQCLTNLGELFNNQYGIISPKTQIFKFSIITTTTPSSITMTTLFTESSFINKFSCSYLK